MALDRPDEAIDACVRCLAFEPNNAGVKALKQRVETAYASKQKKEAEREARRKNEEALATKLRRAFQVLSVQFHHPRRHHGDKSMSC